MGEGIGKTKGNSFEVAYKIPLKLAKDRLEGQIVFSITRTKKAPGVKLGETKGSVEKKKGEKAGATLTAALLKTDLLNSGEILPGVTLKVDTSLFEGKLESSGKIDLDVIKINGVIEGNLVAPDDPAKGTGSDLLDAIVGDFSDDLEQVATAKISGKISIKIDPSDLVKLKRLAETHRQIAKNLAETKKLEDAAKAIKENDKKLKDLLSQKGTKGKAGSKKAREKILKQIEKNKKNLAAVEKKIVNNKKAYDGLAKGGKALVQSLKSKEGRLVAEGLKKAGGAFIKKLIPGLNIASTLYDIYEIGSAIYSIVKADGKVEFGAGGDDGGGGGGEGGVPLDIENLTDEQVDALLEGSPDLPEEATTPTETDTASDDKVQLSTTAAALLAAMKKKGIKAAKSMTREDIEDLNEALPDNITSEELDALLDAIEAGEFKEGKDAFDLIGGIHKRLADIRGGRVNPPGPDEAAADAPKEPAPEPADEPMVPPPPEPDDKTKLHPAAKKVAEALATQKGLKVSKEDLLRLNDVVPKDLTPDQLKALLDRIGEANKVPAKDFNEVLKSVEKSVEEARKAAPGQPAGEDAGGDAEGDAAENGQKPGQPAAPQDITDPAKLKKLQDAIAAAEKTLQQTGFNQVWMPVGDTKLEMQMKPGQSYDVFFAMNSKIGVVGNWMKIVVVTPNAKAKTAEIQIYATTLYNAQGKAVGKTKTAKTVTNMRD